MSCVQLKLQIAAKQADLTKTQDALKAHDDHMNYLISVFEQEIYELNVKLQLAEAEETFAEADSKRLVGAWELPNENTEDDPCYHCGRANYSCICQSAPNESHDIWQDDVLDGMPKGITVTASPRPISYARPEGTKLKWVSDSNPETYRVAIVKNDGILEVKRVTDGRGYCHDIEFCMCKPCNNINDYLSQPIRPFPVRLPLIKTFFKDEAAWRESLPAGGTVTITEPQISDRALRVLCMRPLKEKTDALRLDELQKRFPGAKFVLTTTHQQYEITYKDDLDYGNIYCEDAHISAPFFDIFGTFANGKPQLMAEWRGLYIDLSHLF